MRYFLTILLLVAAVTAPHIVNADSICTSSTVGKTCVITSGLNGVCDLNNICQPPSGGTGKSGGATQPGGTGTVSPTENQTPTSITLENPLGGGICKTPGNCLQDFLQSILQLAIRIGTIVIILMIIYIGFMFVTARGEPAKISTARTALLWTVVGALILLGAQAIASGIQATVQALGS